ncbi:MAG: Mur ligase family protein, partial [Acidobacteria bacterium]|nr:Mur ligase family protein [Acidobacteriota bacterium]
MRSFLAEELLKFEGSHLLGNSFAVFKGMTYDSRTVEKGNLFVALKGENVDGNDFVEKAFENGASVVLCSRKVKPPEGKAIVYAENPEKIIGEFASCLRSKFRGSVIGIVGSAGKTTTKDFCAKFLSELDLTYFSQGNKNNLLGVPQTIVNADFEAKYWVLEMGISFTNEMDLLANIVKPNIVIFTSIKPVHLEFLHSLENIFAEKSNVLKHLC